MAEDEFTNVTEGMDEIHSSNNDQEKSCEAKVFAMHFNVSKCREDVGLLQSAADSASDSEIQHKDRMVMVVIMQRSQQQDKISNRKI